MKRGPYLQGARLTAWELARSGIDVKVICDNSAAYWFGRGEVTLTVVGADRIAENGDFANKIGTYGLACLSKVHERPFYVAAPWSTVDMACESGANIPIEHRDPREITEFVRADIRPSDIGLVTVRRAAARQRARGIPRSTDSASFPPASAC